MKDKQEVVSDFNELVNMTSSELESWLKSDDSNSAGWPKSSGDGDGESVGHESGRKIVEILNDNPEKDPEKYSDEQVEHMRKVVAYCKRHLAQESAGNKDKSEEEVKKTKSYASLKNWGHDFLKAQDKSGGEDTRKSGPAKKKSEAEEDNEEENDGVDNGEGNVGSKRKKSGDEDGPSKKRETHKGESKTDGKADDEEEESVSQEKEDSTDEDEEGDLEAKGQTNGGGKEAKNPSKGDTVSWNWGSGQPEGKVLDVKEDKASITTKRGNEVSKNGTSDDPAVVLDTGKSKAVKLAHELN